MTTSFIPRLRALDERIEEMQDGIIAIRDRKRRDEEIIRVVEQFARRLFKRKECKALKFVCSEIGETYRVTAARVWAWYAGGHLSPAMKDKVKEALPKQEILDEVAAKVKGKGAR